MIKIIKRLFKHIFHHKPVAAPMKIQFANGDTVEIKDKRGTHIKRILKGNGK